MGGSFSKNVVEVAADMSATVLNQTFEEMQTEVDANLVVRFGPGCKMNNVDIKQSQIIQVQKSAMQAAFNSTQVKQTIEAQIHQMAETVTQNFSLNMSKKKAENFAEMFFDLATAVVNTVSQDCSQSILLNQEVTCDAAGGGAAIGDVNVDQSQVANFLGRCLQQSQSVGKIAQDIQVAFDQTASVVEKNALMWLGLIAGIVIVFIVMFVQAGKTVVERVTNWKFIVAMTPLIGFGVYLAIAASTESWPFAQNRKLRENDNIVVVEWDGTRRNELKTPAQVCEEQGYHSVAYVLVAEPYAEDPEGKAMIKVIKYNLNEPMKTFQVFCRKKPSKLAGCEESEYECPGELTITPCCNKASNCAGDGMTGCKK